MTSLLSGIKRNGRTLQTVRKRLLSPSPEDVRGCAVELARVVASLEELRDRLEKDERHGDFANFRLEVTSLRAEVKRVATLLQSAEGFYSGWATMAGLGPDLSGSDYGSMRRSFGPCGRLIIHG